MAIKLNLNWLKDFIEFEKSLEELGEALTNIGLEVEEIIERSDLNQFKVAEIVEATKHAESDKLNICKVNDGSGNILQIICGASNARAGIKVVLAPLGAVIPVNGIVIKQAKIRGVESQGMLCSAEELIVKNNEGPGKIIELPSEAEVGGLALPYLKGSDSLISLSITPNRGDCLSIYGIARDLAAAGFGKLKELILPNINSKFSCPISVGIEEQAKDLCLKFTGRVIKSLNNKIESPEWLW
jgi:phenylalanyl-tRNA synthetase beta chain